VGRREVARGRYTDTVSLDLGTVEPSLAGPARPRTRQRPRREDLLQRGERRVPGAHQAPKKKHLPEAGVMPSTPDEEAAAKQVENGSIVIAAITSCTNTSNPSVLMAAGILAKKAVEKGLTTKPWVKTSIGPGSKVVTEYLEAAGLLTYLERLNFYVVGYGCTTCIGNSGPLPPAISRAIDDKDLFVVSVLSGNRNFEGRVMPRSAPTTSRRRRSSLPTRSRAPRTSTSPASRSAPARTASPSS